MRLMRSRIPFDPSPDRLLALGGLALGAISVLIFVVIGVYQSIGLAITLLLTCSSYLLFGTFLDKPISDREPRSRMRISIFESVRSSALFTGMVAIALLACVYASANSLHRPLWVFLTLALVSGLIFLQSVHCNINHDIYPYLLVQLVIFCFALVLSGVTVFPFNGSDTWTHLFNAQEVVNNHTFLGIRNAYRDYPVYPALVAVFSMITGFNVSDVARYFNVLVAAIGILMWYALSREFKASIYHAVTVSLLLLGSKWFMYWLMLVVSMTTGLVFFCFLLLILLRRLVRNIDQKEGLLLLLTSALIPFIHPLIALATIFLLIGFWLVDLVFHSDQSKSSPLTLLILVIYNVVVMLTQWMYYGQSMFARAVISMARVFYFEGGQSPLGLAASYREPFTYLFDNVNFYVFLGLAGLEILRQAKQRTSKLNLYTGSLGLLFLIFGYLAQIISFQDILPYRWLLFANALLVFSAATTFVRLFRVHTWRGRAAAAAVIVLYFFGGLANTEANRDHPLYSGEITQHYELTSPEYAGMLALREIIQQTDSYVRVDFRLWDYLKLVSWEKKFGYWRTVHLEGFDGIFSLRNVYFTRFGLVGDSTIGLDRKQPNLSQFYDSGDLQILDHVIDIKP